MADIISKIKLNNISYAIADSVARSQLSGKQNSITANGLLKSDGTGAVSAAVQGTDYSVASINGNVITIDGNSIMVKTGEVDDKVTKLWREDESMVHDADGYLYETTVQGNYWTRSNSSGAFTYSGLFDNKYTWTNSNYGWQITYDKSNGEIKFVNTVIDTIAAGIDPIKTNYDFGTITYNSYTYTFSKREVKPNDDAYDKFILSTELSAVLLSKQDTLNDEQLSAVNSGIDEQIVTDTLNHIDDSDIHVTTDNKTYWNGKQDALTEEEISAIDMVSGHVTDTDIHVTAEDKELWNNKATVTIVSWED